MKPLEDIGESTASGPSGNLGLGLYIAERIVCAHQGSIEVSSSDAGGTTFTVHLPRHPQGTAACAPPDRPDRGRRSA
jgi:signal transduction histidine kinase